MDIVFAPCGRRGLPTGLRHDSSRVGAIARATRGPGPAGPLRRRRDRRRDPVRAGSRRAGLLRSEGCPAGRGHPADGPRPRHPDRGRRLPHGSRAGRTGNVVAQCPPVHGRAASRRRCSTRRSYAAREAWAAGERSADALRDRMRAQLSEQPLADVEYVSCADAATLAELDRSSIGRRCCPLPFASERPGSSTTSHLP